MGRWETSLKPSVRQIRQALGASHRWKLALAMHRWDQLLGAIAAGCGCCYASALSGCADFDKRRWLDIFNRLVRDGTYYLLTKAEGFTATERDHSSLGIWGGRIHPPTINLSLGYFVLNPASAGLALILAEPRPH